ncbi:MAG: UDP-glucose--hexose-1-phosphate uridylyltransferase [Culicoidibacterales bacterium]
MMEIQTAINRLLAFAKQHELIQPEDIIYSANQLLGLLGLTTFEYEELSIELCENPAKLLIPILEFAIQRELIEDTITMRDLFDTKIMNCLMPRPSEVIRQFQQLYKQSPNEATNDYYRLSKASHYIRTDRTDKNIVWQTPTVDGVLDITINLSKPEKDPREIAAAKHSQAANYPKCLLCCENEGFFGNLIQPARNNHRIIPVQLQQEQWFLQYSPYVYYNEHCIVLKGVHEPMKLQKTTFARLLDFVEQFPHYFIGSNADLPIVGGSILAHDHFQGGRYTFAMERATTKTLHKFKNFPDVTLAQVNWPMSVLRLQSKNKHELVLAADKVFQTWYTYNDETVEIRAFSGDTPHNTVTPIARIRDGYYELDLVLRNNRTSEEHPFGIFHPHADVHHIKKENIGLIEVMGLAVLPARLADELVKLEQAFTTKVLDTERYPELVQHEAWFYELVEKHADIKQADIYTMLQQEVGYKFMRVLADAGVFKRDTVGQASFERFIVNFIV